MADLEKLAGTIDGIEANVLKALAVGDKVAELDAALQAAVTEFKGEVDTMKADTKLSKENAETLKSMDTRLQDFERRYGRANQPGGKQEPEMHAEKSFGAQVTDWLDANPGLKSRAKGGGETSRLELTGASIRDAYGAAQVVKALGQVPSDENVRKALMLLSDNATVTPIQRLPTVMPMQGRRRVVQDLIPSINVEVGTLEYLEWLGLAPSTYLTATSIAGSGTTATLTYTAHGARVGDRIIVKDSTDTDYNGIFFVTSVPDANTLTYTMAADPADDTADGTILWANLTTWGAAATVAENALKPESRLESRTITAYIELIAHIFRISKQMLDDVPGLQSEINGAGIRGLQELIEYKLLYGDGTSNTIDGFLHKAGVQAYTQAVTGDVGRLKGFRHLITMLENVGAMPTAAIANPSDWELYETSVGLDDHFLIPGVIQGGANQVLWRVPVATSRYIAPGTILMGDFSEGAKLLNRQGAQVSFTDSDGDDFKYNRVAMRFEQRLGLMIQRPEFFVNYTLTS